MGFLSWLTGRDEKESDVYANFERVDEVVTSLKKVSADDVTNAADAVKAAVIELNNVKGMAEFVGQVNADSFTPTFERVTATIDQVSTMIQQKADNIKVYEESKWYEKLGSTFAMAGAKLAEGALSVVEDLGDGVVSLVGWVAPKDSGVEKWCSEFVQKEWSHDAFNFYYESEFAKKSAFTEDSGLAGACKLIGTTATYMFAGGVVAGAGKAKAAATATKAASAATKATKAGKIATTVGKIGTKASAAVSKIGGLASASTWGATAVAGVAGLGSGTESALLEGADFNAAVWSGTKQGLGQAALAFAGGKLGERISKGIELKAANRNLTNVTNNYTRALSNTTDDAVRTAGRAVTSASDDLARVAANSTDDAVKAAQKAVASTSDDVLRATANTTDDAVRAANRQLTQATSDLMKTAANTTDDAVRVAGETAAKTNSELVKAIANSSDDAVKATQKALTGAYDDAAKALANTSDDVVKTTQKALTNAYDDLAKAYVNGSDDVIKAAEKAVINATDDAAKALANTTDDALKVAQKALTNASDDAVKALANTTDDAIKTAQKAALNASDDLVKAVSNSSDDTLRLAQRAVTSAQDDLASAVSNTTDKGLRLAQKAAQNATDDFAKAIANTTDDAVKVANEAVKTATSTLDDAIANTTDDVLKQASKAVDDALDNVINTQNAKLSSFEGYNDSLSRAGRDVGEKAMNNVIQKGFIKGTAANIGGTVKAAANAGASMGKAVIHPIQTGRSVATSIGQAMPNSIKEVPGAMLSTAKAVVTSPATPGVVAQTINAGINNSQAADNIPALAGVNVDVTGPTTEEFDQGYTVATDPKGDTIPSEQQYRMGSETVPNDTTGNGGNAGNPGGNSGGGYPGGGYPGGGYPGGGETGGTNTGGTNTGGETGGTNTGGTNTGGTNTGGTNPGGYTGPADETGNETHTGSGFGEDEFSGKPFEIDDEFSDEFDSLGDIIANGDKLTEIPESSTPIKAESKGGASAVIPIAAGLSAAAAAGIGAKVYMDKKNNSDNGEDDEFDTDDWSEEDQIEIDYDESEGSIADQYLKDEDDYGYQADTGERYGARTNEELADLQ